MGTVPGAQERQVVWAMEGLYVPVGQIVHILLSAYVPIGQAVQDVIPATDVYPAAQAVHDVLRAEALNVPAGQSEQRYAFA